MKNILPIAVANTALQILVVDEIHHGQRIDNFLFTQFKGVPKTRLYRALRSGECRVNKKRIQASYRLQVGDVIRIPPLRVSLVQKKDIKPPPKTILQQLEAAVIYEDAHIILINKPSGMAVHGGSGIHFGIIEGFRHARPKLKFLELVHRLDRETTGCLLLAKKPSILKALHQLLVNKKIDKQYLALVAGGWRGGKQRVNQPLLKNTLSSGERVVKVDSNGKSAETIFIPIQTFKQATLVLAKPLTGRTHQIRVHAAYMGYPILGDDKYGDKQLNKMHGIQRLLLHAASLSFQLPDSLETFSMCACLDKYFLTELKNMDEDL